MIKIPIKQRIISWKVRPRFFPRLTWTPNWSMWNPAAPNWVAHSQANQLRFQQHLTTRNEAHLRDFAMPTARASPLQRFLPIPARLSGPLNTRCSWVIEPKSANRINCLLSSLKTGWWFQPIWKICSSNWIISPGIGVKIKQYLKPAPRKGCWLAGVTSH